MKVNLTKHQIQLLIIGCRYSYNDDFPASDSANKSIARLEKKLTKILEEAEDD